MIPDLFISYSRKNTKEATDLANLLRQGRFRVSPHFYNTEEEIKRLMANLLE
jgi:selenocysteine lyase/cysteine desulfurase